MHPLAEKLLAQHIEFELDALTDKRVGPYIRSEVQRWFEHAETRPLNEYVTEQRCVSAFKRLLVGTPIPRSAGEYFMSAFSCFAGSLEAAEVDLEAVIGPDLFLELVQLATSLHEPRRRLLAKLLHHPLYSELISSLVYQALLNYLIEDNLISQRVPGVGSMLKLGRKVASRAVPGLDATVERQLKGFIKGNLPSLIKTSEQFVDDTLTDEELEDRIAEAWKEIRSRRLAGLADGFDPEDAERLRDWNQRYWDELRRSDCFSELGATLIAHFFERYGKAPLAELLRDFGVTPVLVNKELIAFAPPLLKRLRKSGYLGDMLRRRLTPFYESVAVADTLGPSAGP